MAGIWVSVLIGGLLVVVTIAALVGSSVPSPDKIEEGSVLQFKLSGTVVDRTTTPSLMEFLRSIDNRPLSLSEITGALRAAKSDDKIKGALFEFDGLSIGLAQCEELRGAMAEFREEGKWIWVYADNYSQSEYYIAGAADRLVLNPIGMVDVHGLSATTFYLKDLLSKIGIEMQVVKVGTYKSAVEPFLLSSMSDANREQLNHFLGRMWDNLKATIGKDRKVAPDSVDLWANGFSFNFTGEEYVEKKMVDELLYRTDVDQKLLELSGVEAAGEDADSAKMRKPRYVKYTEYNKAHQTEQLLADLTADGRTNIAVLYAEGDITENGSDGIAATRLVAQINKIAASKNIDGLVLRVNSGGGSAFASEQIWKALTEYKANTGKPLYVSMGDMAASGGYYISCCADKIYASPLTLTGSIGIFGLIPNAQGLLKTKLGVNTEVVATNTGRFPDIFQPMDPGQRAAMQSYVDRGYELFVKRCAEGRNLSVDQIKAVAEGRVWDGLSALENGLVDELGGLDATVRAMAEALGKDFTEVSVVLYPRNQINWWESFAEVEGQVQALMSAPTIDDIEPAMLRSIVNRIRNIDPLQARIDLMLVH